MSTSATGSREGDIENLANTIEDRTLRAAHSARGDRFEEQVRVNHLCMCSCTRPKN